MITHTTTLLRSRAFTLVEILVVLAVLGAVASITFFGMSNYGQRQQFEEFTSDVARSVQSAKQRAVAGEAGTAWGIYVSPTSIEVFSGTTVTPGASANTIIAVPAYVTASSTFYTGEQSLVFAERTGTPTATGTIVLADTRTLSTTTIIIGAGGLIE